MEADIPKHITYWMTSSSKHDCFFNVGLESEPKERIGAIRIFLTGHSEVLRRMLEESPLAEKEDISVCDTDPETFRNFLKCIYGGAENVIEKLSFEECLNILYLCEKYLTLELRENISRLIVAKYQPLSKENVFKGLLNPACLESTIMANAFGIVIQNHTDEILNNKLFLDLSSKAVEFIVKQDKITIKEVDLWKSVLNWAMKKTESKDPKELRAYLVNILKYIRFCAMESNDFCTLIPSGVLTQEEVFEICKSIGTASPPELGDRICNELTIRSKIIHKKTTDDSIHTKNFSGPKKVFQVELGSCYFTLEASKVWHSNDLELKLHCVRTGSRKCFVKIKVLVGACVCCDRCNCKSSNSFSTEISSSRSSQNLGRFSKKDDWLSVLVDLEVEEEL